MAATLALRQAGQACTDFAGIERDVQFIMEQSARSSARQDLWQAALMLRSGGSALILALLWIEHSGGKLRARSST